MCAFSTNHCPHNRVQKMSPLNRRFRWTRWNTRGNAYMWVTGFGLRVNITTSCVRREKGEGEGARATVHLWVSQMERKRGGIHCTAVTPRVSSKYCLFIR